MAVIVNEQSTCHLEATPIHTLRPDDQPVGVDSGQPQAKHSSLRQTRVEERGRLLGVSGGEVKFREV